MVVHYLRRELDAIRAFGPARILSTSLTLTLTLVLVALDSAAVASDAAVTLGGEWGLITNEATYNFLRLDDEGGIWSAYGYVQLLAITTILVAVASRHREIAYLFLAAAFLITGLDDMLALHEAFGADAVERLEVSAGPNSLLRGVLELGFLAVAGAIVLALLVGARLGCAPRHRAPTLLLTLALLAVGFCSVVLNFAEAATFETSRFVGKAFSLLDDGGELFFSSVALVIATWLLLQPRAEADRPFEPALAARNG